MHQANYVVMTGKTADKGKYRRDLALFPIVFNAVGLPIIFLLYAVSPGYYVDPGTLNTVVLASLFPPWWGFAFLVIRRLKQKDVSIKEYIMPRGKFNLLPALLLFVLLNFLFDGYMVVALMYGRIPRMTDLHPLQIVFLLLLVPLTAGFTEELIWRGYLIDELLSAGNSETKAIIYSSVSFAFIHGFMLFDKLIVTFLFGMIAGLYYVRQRNLLVLMSTHVAVDVISYALTIFAFG